MSIGRGRSEGLMAGRAFGETPDLESLGGGVADNNGIAVSTEEDAVSGWSLDQSETETHRTISRPSLGWYAIRDMMLNVRDQ